MTDLGSMVTICWLWDISNILNDIDESHAVSVVQHDYGSGKAKYLGGKQYSYPEKLVVIYSVELYHPSNRGVDPSS